MNRTLISKLINEACLQRGIHDRRYVAAMIWQESKGESTAYRYEPGFYRRYIEGKTKDELGGYWPKYITEDSERMFRSTSFGLMQIMGQVARENGFDKASLAYLFDPTENIWISTRHLSMLITRDGGTGWDMWLRVLTRWNGAQEYAYKVREIVETGRYKNVYIY